MTTAREQHPAVHIALSCMGTTGLGCNPLPSIILPVPRAPQGPVSSERFQSYVAEPLPDLGPHDLCPQPRVSANLLFRQQVFFTWH